MATNVESTHCIFKEDFRTIKNGFHHENLSSYLSNFVELENSEEGFNKKYSRDNHLIQKQGNNDSKLNASGIALLIQYFKGVLYDIYLNVTTGRQVAKPYFTENEDNVKMWYVPHLFTAIRDEVRKNGLKSSKCVAVESTIKVVDIIVNPYCLQQIQEDNKLYYIFLNFVKSALSKYLEIDIKMVDVLGFDIYIGDPDIAVKESTEALEINGFNHLNGRQAIDSIAICENNLKQEVLEKGEPNHKSSQAWYKINYINDTNNCDTGNEPNSSKDRPYLISLDFYLPGVDCINDIYIETDGKEIKLQTENGLALEVKMDFPMQKDPLKSTFFKDKNMLNLQLKISEIGFKKINLDQTIIECLEKESPQQESTIDKAKPFLPEYKVTQSMTEYALTINSNSMVKGSLKHLYVGNDALEVSFKKYGPTSAPIQCRLIFDVSPRKVHFAKSFLNQSKKSLQFTIKKVIPKISIKAKIGSCYNSLEEIKILYFETRHSKKKGKPSDWIRTSPERTRSLSESSASGCIDEQLHSNLTNGGKRIRQNSLSNTRKKSEYFLTSSWPKGILKRSHSTSESTYGVHQDNVFDEYDYLEESCKYDSMQSLSSTNSLYGGSSSDSISYLSGLESPLGDLSIECSSPQKRVAFSGVILKEVYKPSLSIVGAKNRRDYLKKKQILNKKIKNGNCEAQKELKKLNQAYEENVSNSLDNEPYVDFPVYNKSTAKESKKKNRIKKDPLQHLDKEDLIFSLEDDH